MKLSNLQWAYLAGIFDGEGSFSIARGGRKPGYGHIKGYINYQLMISVGNTNMKLHRWLLKIVGGVKYQGHRSKTNRQKDGYNWRLHGKENQKKFILGVFPHLLLKKRQSLIALKMIDLEGKQPHKRQLLWIKMRELNHKGKNRRD